MIGVIAIAPIDDRPLIHFDAAQVNGDMAISEDPARTIREALTRKPTIGAANSAILKLRASDLRMDKRLDRRSVSQHVLDRIHVTAVIDHVGRFVRRANKHAACVLSGVERRLSVTFRALALAQQRHGGEDIMHVEYLDLTNVFVHVRAGASVDELLLAGVRLELVTLHRRMLVVLNHHQLTVQRPVECAQHVDALSDLSRRLTLGAKRAPLV